MATVPAAELPQVAPDARPPADYIEPRSSPADFGAAIGEGAQKLGAGALNAAHFYGQVAADNAANEFQDRSSKILYGDPERQVMGPDGQMQTDTGYFGLKGRAALDKRKETERGLDDLLQQTRSGLTSPAQQLEFDNITRRYRSYLGGQIGRHADTEYSVWNTHVNKATADLQIDHIARTAYDEDQFLHGLEDLKRARVRQAQIMGGGDLIPAALASAERDAIKARVQSIGVKDPTLALRILDDNRDMAGAEYDNLANPLRARAMQQDGITIADSELARTAPLVGGTDPVKAAILGQESSNRDDIPDSPAGARGPGQIIPDTFKRFAQPGEQIDVPADNRRVSGRIIDNLAARFGNDPARIAVGYFSGEGNVAPEGSPTPWIADHADKTGKKTSEYVADVMGRLGSSGAPGPAAARASLYDRVIEATKGKPPEVQRAALNHLREQQSAADIANFNDKRARQEANDTAANGYTTQILTDKMGPDIVARIANDPNLTWETKRTLNTMVDQATKGEPMAAVSHQTVVKLLDDMRRPEGDPRRISDLSPVYEAFSKGELSKADFNFAQQQYRDMQTPEGDRLGQRQKEFFAAVRPSIEKSNPLLGHIDFSGGTLFYQFQQDVAQKVAEARKNGKDPFDLFNPAKPEYLGKPGAIAPYQRSIAESSAEYTARMRAGKAPPLAPLIIPADMPGGNDRMRRPGETMQQFLKRTEGK
jgi:hypothetical protein